MGRVRKTQFTCPSEHKKGSSRRPHASLDDPGTFRRELGLNQATYWRRAGATQSAGSRYENLRNLPVSVAMLLLIAERGLLDAEQLELLAADASAAVVTPSE